LASLTIYYIYCVSEKKNGNSGHGYVGTPKPSLLEKPVLPEQRNLKTSIPVGTEFLKAIKVEKNPLSAFYVLSEFLLLR
jgi:hypothetical protein